MFRAKYDSLIDRNSQTCPLEKVCLQHLVNKIQSKKQCERQLRDRMGHWTSLPRCQSSCCVPLSLKGLALSKVTAWFRVKNAPVRPKIGHQEEVCEKNHTHKVSFNQISVPETTKCWSASCATRVRLFC